MVKVRVTVKIKETATKAEKETARVKTQTRSPIKCVTCSNRASAPAATGAGISMSDLEGVAALTKLPHSPSRGVMLASEAVSPLEMLAWMRVHAAASPRGEHAW